MAPRLLRTSALLGVLLVACAPAPGSTASPDPSPSAVPDAPPDFPVTLIDDAGKTAIAYGVGGVPETFFLDRSGTIVAKYSGPLTTDELRSNLRKAMQP